MQMRIVDGTHSKMESIATAVNSAIRQMEGRQPVDVAVLGYHRNAAGEPEIGSRLGGQFAGRIWVSSDELIASPVRVEVRTKQMVNPVTRAVTPMTVDFPIWFEPQIGPGKLEHLTAFEFLAQQLLNWVEAAQPAAPPLIFSFLQDLQPGESIANAVVPLGQVSTPQGFPYLLQFHAGTYANVPAIKYPTVPQFLPYGPVQELFFACSPLTESMMNSLRQNQEFPAPGAKGLVYHGRMIDMVRMLGFLKIYQSILPANPGAAPAANTESLSRNAPSPLPASGMPASGATVPAMGVPSSMALPPTTATAPVGVPSCCQPVNQPTMPPLRTASDSTNLPVSPSETADPDPVIRPLPPRIRKEANPERGRVQMPDLLSKTASVNEMFDDFDQADDEDDSMTNIPAIENLPEIKSEIIPNGFEFCCKPLETNKKVEEPASLPPRQTLLILLVDRSVSDLTYKPSIETWNRRLEKTRFMLGELARRGRGRYDTALVFYGKEPDASTSAISDTLGKTFLSDNCLMESAGRVEPMMIQIPNGIGGLISLPRKKLCFTECSPTYPADPTAGFQRVVEIVREWDAARSSKLLPPVLVHVTAGKFQTEKLDAAIELLTVPDLPPICLQHWVFTERPHSGVCCPSEESFTADEGLQLLWERTDPLPAREFLAGVRPGIHEESRGMMVNMDFDVLFEVLDTLARKTSQSQNR